MTALGTLRLAHPEYGWLLAGVVLLLPLLLWRIGLWRRDLRALRRRRVLPVRERFAALGPWPFWLCVLLALGLTLLAAARPQARVARVRTAGIDLIVLQDGSASMHVHDVGTTRWQRSMRFVRTLVESLEWEDDRMALALFARIAAPQVRLTRDPNTIFFFLDHLDEVSPFPLADDTTWDTNIELGMYWGMRLLERDEELNGASDNVKAFVLISDGQAWSGAVETALSRARSRNIPVFVVGVGTQAGGLIPEPPPDPLDQRPPSSGPIRSSLNRTALQAIATAGRGVYFDLGQRDDVDVADAIIGSARSRAGSRGVEEAVEELYWWCLAGAAGFLGLSVCFIRDRGEALLQAIGAMAALMAAWPLFR
jgi:Ca-activated chloride channel family protein